MIGLRLGQYLLDASLLLPSGQTLGNSWDRFEATAVLMLLTYARYMTTEFLDVPERARIEPEYLFRR